MLQKYAAAFAALPPDAAAFMWSALRAKFPDRMPRPQDIKGEGGAALFLACSSADLYQAEVVMAIVDSPEPQARQALDVLMGKSIRPAAPPAAKPHARCNYPNCKCPIGEGATHASKVCPLGLPGGAPAAAPTQPAERAKPPARQAQRRDPRVVLEVAPNPRKEGSAAHRGYACWAVGDTVDQCIARGLPQRYVRKDTGKGRVRLGPVPR